jgi:hypothetical protein
MQVIYGMTRSYSHFICIDIGKKLISCRLRQNITYGRKEDENGLLDVYSVNDNHMKCDGMV